MHVRRCVSSMQAPDKLWLSLLCSGIDLGGVSLLRAQTDASSGVDCKSDVSQAT